MGPGTNPEKYIYLDHKWGIRAVPAGGRIFFYVDGPFDGVDDGSINDVFPWERYLLKDDFNFLLGDYSGVPDVWKGYAVFKQSCHVKSSTFPFFYSTMIEKESKPISSASKLVGFVGAMSHPCREELRNIPDSYFASNDKIFWSYSEEEQKSLHSNYLELLEDTQFVICPRGKGLTSIRFFETLRMGRIPILISDDIQLPLDWMVDWSDFIIRVPECEISTVVDRVKDWNKDPEEASKLARWVSMEWFSDPEKYINAYTSRILDHAS